MTRQAAQRRTIQVRLDGRLGAFRLDVDFQVPMQGITALFGPSGCGKTSVLRAMAGLQHMQGKIVVGDEVWQDASRFRPPHQRPIGYIFQEASLFQHLSVRKNLRFGERRSKVADPSIHFDDVVDLLGLAHLVDRHPAHLSGGERQRVSIGRALLSQPRLLLMDEPLSALDRMAKDEILPYFEALHASLELPIILVSHDISEVERLADHLVALENGRVVSSAPLNRALTDPALPFARGRDSAAVLPATVLRKDDDGIAVLDVLGTQILVIDDGLQERRPVRIRIAASDVSIARVRPSGSSILNMLTARIVGIDAVGSAEANVRLSLADRPGFDFIARLSRRSLSRLDLRVGETVVAQIKSVSFSAQARPEPAHDDARPSITDDALKMA